MSRRFDERDLAALGRVSTVLFVLALFAVLFVFTIGVTRLAIPALMAPTLLSLDRLVFVAFFCSLGVLVAGLATLSSRGDPPLRVVRPSRVDRPETILAGLLLLATGVTLSVPTLHGIGSSIADSGGVFHGLLGVVPLFVGLAAIVSGLSALVEAGSLSTVSSERRQTPTADSGRPDGVSDTETGSGRDYRRRS